MFRETTPPENSQKNAPKKTKWLQRRLLVDVRVQLIFLCHSLSLLVAGLGLLWFHRLLMDFLGIQEVSLYNADWPAVVYFASGVVMFFLLTLLQLELTNRVFGPIYRMKQHMRHLANGGEITNFHTRKNDFLGDFNEAYNAVLKRLEDAEGGARNASGSDSDGAPSSASERRQA